MTKKTEDIVAMAVENTFDRLGFDMKNPDGIKKDIGHLRRSRQICELIQNTAINVAVGAGISGGLGLLWWGFLTVSKAGQ